MLIKSGLRNTYRTQLSDNIYIDQNDFLICERAILGRSGIYKYTAKELGLDRDGIVEILRKEEDVFNEDSLKSLEQRPVTINHPREFVDINNCKELSKGEVYNVRREGENIIADIIIKDKTLRDYILNKKLKELSLGYTYDLDYDDSSQFYTVKNIIYNHLAFVKKGRAGNAMVRDGENIMENELEDKVLETKEEVVEEVVEKEEETINDTKEEVNDTEEKVEDSVEEVETEVKDEEVEDKATCEDTTTVPTEDENKKMDDNSTQVPTEGQDEAEVQEDNKENEGETKVMKDTAYFLKKQQEIASITDEAMKKQMSMILSQEMNEYLKENSITDSAEDDIVVETTNEQTDVLTYEEQMQEYYNKFNPNYYDDPSEALSFYKKECNNKKYNARKK